MTEPHDYYDRDKEPTNGIWGAIIVVAIGIGSFIWAVVELIKLIF